MITSNNCCIVHNTRNTPNRTYKQNATNVQNMLNNNTETHKLQHNTKVPQNATNIQIKQEFQHTQNTARISPKLKHTAINYNKQTIQKPHKLQQIL